MPRNMDGTTCSTTAAVRAIRSRVFPAHTPLLGRRSIEWARELISRGRLPNSQQDLARWIQHPQKIRPGTAMPELGMTPQDAEEIAEYLEELR